MKYLQLLAYSFFCLSLYVFFAAPTQAACTPIYGGGPTCTTSTLSVQTDVRNPSSNTFVHNLGLADAKYHAGDTVVFHITLTNTGNAAIGSTIIKDSFPGVITFTSGPGTFDTASHILTIQEQNLLPHHSQTYTITTQVVGQSAFPSTAFCANNRVSALPSLGSIVQDSSQFCLEKLTSTPATGPDALEVVSLLPLGLIGFTIRRFAKYKSL